MNFITREDKKRISQSYYYSIEDTCLAVGSTKNHTPYLNNSSDESDRYRLLIDFPELFYYCQKYVYNQTEN